MIGEMIGSAAGGYLGGPAGAAIGSALGGSVDKVFDKVVHTLVPDEGSHDKAADDKDAGDKSEVQPKSDTLCKSPELNLGLSTLGGTPMVLSIPAIISPAHNS
ncbi:MULTISPECIES: hypothetical protein [Bradyrhizobium]|uniref:hypothetical protein n=1 Tax=Bradyrhizobium TaxID=374 RepID=UPI00155E0276|nr:MULTISPECIES: hypothetical protein [Bradyrhizobium]MDA9419188.1 hypothetical protein [Bradyrhizobium sp. CCBAU 25360]MDA9512328.1 hypothetical protein [Bradyrhizobium sp. CCBAU 11430]MDD1521624.1 hypothetical protein [Bradyrhizobium sp. WBAH30]MDD1546031.1 hypothetical protein [Bradyrhizobium sp. WBAH41]MDD1559233.1 hypothetical protein [Bradyrhizobium sp. WBAH23]